MKEDYSNKEMTSVENKETVSELSKIIQGCLAKVELGMAPKDAINVDARKIIDCYKSSPSQVLSDAEKSVLRHLGYKFGNNPLPSIENVFDKEGKRGCC